MTSNSFLLPVEEIDPVGSARTDARLAAMEANAGLRHKEQFYFHEAILRRWSEMMINAPIFIHNVLFATAMVVDIAVSWEIVRSIVRENISLNPKLEWLPTLLICLVINLWAAVTAHLIGKGWSKEIQDWERWNFFFIKNQRVFRERELEPTLRREIRRSRWLAFFSASVLLCLLGSMIYFRNKVLGEGLELDGADPTVAILQLVLTILPIAIILCEFVTGDYIWYSMRRFARTRKRNKHFAAFVGHREKCGEYDQDVFTMMSQKGWNADSPEATGDMGKAFNRARHRSQDKDDYLDPIDSLRKIGFTFHFRESKNPVARVRVFGTLANGAKTGDYLTDETGHVTLQIGAWEKLETIWVDDYREIAGPFQSEAEHFIDIPSFAETLNNGNGPSVPIP